MFRVKSFVSAVKVTRYLGGACGFDSAEDIAKILTAPVAKHLVNGAGHFWPDPLASWPNQRNYAPMNSRRSACSRAMWVNISPWGAPS